MKYCNIKATGRLQIWKRKQLTKKQLIENIDRFDFDKEQKLQ